MIESDEPAREARLVRRAVAFAAAASLIGLGLGPRIGLSVLGGAAVSVLNLLVLRRMAAGLAAPASARRAVGLAVVTGLRYLAIAGALVALIALANAHGIGVVCGLGAPLAAVLLELRSAGSAAFGPKPPAGGPPGPDSR